MNDMNWKKIVCFIRGHRYATITVHNLDKHKKEYYYQCTFCGHRSKFSNLRDVVINGVVIDNAEKLLKHERRK